LAEYQNLLQKLHTVKEKTNEKGRLKKKKETKELRK